MSNQILEKIRSKLLNDPTRSDITILDKSHTSHHAHLIILSLHTDFFDTALAPDRFLEGNSRTILLTDHSTASVSAMLQWAYTGVHPFFHQVLSLHKPSPNLIQCFDLYRLADYVFIPDLKSHIVDCMRVAIMSRLSGESKYRSRREKFWKAEFVGFVDDVYLDTNELEGHREIREMVVDGVVKGLMNGMEVEALRECMRNHEGLGMEVLRAHVEAVRREEGGEDGVGVTVPVAEGEGEGIRKRTRLTTGGRRMPRK